MIKSNDLQAGQAIRKLSSSDFRFSLKSLHRFQLDNGLKILLLPDPSVPIVTTMLWYRVGSIWEIPEKTGISHLLEHMMFKGSEKFPKGRIDHLTTRLGGYNNAFTSKDYTAYYFGFASDRWLPVLQLEADRMSAASLDAAEFELEKQVVLEELYMDRDSPWTALREHVEWHFFKEHPYRYPIIGLADDVARLSVEDLRDHYRTFYGPANAALVVVGDFEKKKTIETIKRCFGPIQPGPIPVLQIKPEPMRHSCLQLELQVPSHVARLMIAFPAPPVSRDDQFAIHLLSKILAEGKLCRLYDRLVEQEELASLVSVELNETQHPYVFLIRLELTRKGRPQVVQAILADELRRLACEDVSEQELTRAQNQAISHYLAGLESGFDQAAGIGLLEILDRLDLVEEYPARILAVTSDEIRRVATDYITLERAVVGFVPRGLNGIG